MLAGFSDKRVERVNKASPHPPLQFWRKDPMKTRLRRFSSAQATHWTSLQVSTKLCLFLKEFSNLFSRPTKVRRTTSKLGISAARQRLRSVLWKDSKGHVRRRADSSVRKVWLDLGSASHDGSDDGNQPRIRICHLHIA